MASGCFKCKETGCFKSGTIAGFAQGKQEAQGALEIALQVGLQSAAGGDQAYAVAGG
jgi:hypothetical protein